MDETTKQLVADFGMQELRRLVGSAAAIAVADGVITSDQKGAFIQIGISIAVYLATMFWSWWQARGKAQLHQVNLNLSAQVHSLKLSQSVAGKPQPTVVQASGGIKPGG